MSLAKYLLVVGLGLLLFTFGLSKCADALTLEWDASTSTDVDGYTVYYSNDDDPTTVYIANVDGTTLTLTLDDNLFVRGAGYTFTVRAWNENGESGSSNPVSYTIDAYTPPADVSPTVLQLGPLAPSTLRSL